MITCPFILRTTFPRRSMSDSGGPVSDVEDVYELRVDESSGRDSPIHSVGRLSDCEKLDADDFVGVDELTRRQRSKLLSMSAAEEQREREVGSGQEGVPAASKQHRASPKSSFMTSSSGMPAELLLRIFFEDLFGPDAVDELWMGTTGQIDYAMRLHLVCKEWRYILSHSQSFWSHVLVLAPDVDSWNAILARVGNSPIDFATSLSIDIDSQAEQLPRARSVHILSDSRFRHWNQKINDAGPLNQLHFLYLGRSYLYPLDVPVLQVDAPSLVDLKLDCSAIVKAPSLRRLWIENDGQDADVQHLCNLFVQSRALEEVHLDIPRRWSKGDDWTEILAPLSHGHLRLLEVKANSQLTLKESLFPAVVLQHLRHLYTHVPIRVEANHLHSLVIRAVGVSDIMTMLLNAPNLHTLKIMEYPFRDTPAPDSLSTELGMQAVELPNLRLFTYGGFLDSYVIDLLGRLRLRQLERMDLSVEMPMALHAIQTHVDMPCTSHMIIPERHDDQVHKLHVLRPTLSGFLTGPITFVARTSVFPPASEIDVSFMVQDRRSTTEVWPITLGTTYTQRFCSQLAEGQLQYTTGHFICAFSWPDVEVIKIEVNITYCPRVACDRPTCREQLRDCFVPDPFHIVLKEDRIRMQGQLRQMRKVQELDIAMVRSWETMGLGIFEAIALWPEEEPLLPELKTIRMTAHRHWFRPSVGSGIWWSQLCDVVSQGGRSGAVRVELIGNFCACRNGETVEAGLKKLLGAGTELDLSGASLSLDTGNHVEGKVGLRCHCS
ncbi:hypothetical protein PENSPDRAFT_667716 [Peniophora sp. CONT]|nr:hypothetical protein PENSPDRAFT_667716 [Peniophora sp. CONT]